MFIVHIGGDIGELIVQIVTAGYRRILFFYLLMQKA